MRVCKSCGRQEQASGRAGWDACDNKPPCPSCHKTGLAPLLAVVEQAEKLADYHAGDEFGPFDTPCGCGICTAVRAYREARA
jgi:hypothetical protein